MSGRVPCTDGAGFPTAITIIKKDVRNPRSEFMLKEFEDIVQGQLPLPDGNSYGFVSELNDLQKDILSILDVPLHYYDYQHLIDSS